MEAHFERELAENPQSLVDFRGARRMHAFQWDVQLLEVYRSSSALACLPAHLNALRWLDLVLKLILRTLLNIQVAIKAAS